MEPNYVIVRRAQETRLVHQPTGKFIVLDEHAVKLSQESYEKALRQAQLKLKREIAP